MFPDLPGALCAEVGMPDNIDGARFICESCPVMAECREWALGPALDLMKDAPMLGGMTAKERREATTPAPVPRRTCPACGQTISPKEPRNRTVHPECYRGWATKLIREGTPRCHDCLAVIPKGRRKCDECRDEGRRQTAYRVRLRKSEYKAHEPGKCSVCKAPIAVRRRKCDDCRTYKPRDRRKNEHET